MAERYKRLYALPENLYTSGSPILIQAGALLKDTQTGKILAQLKLKNLFHSTLVACKVSIRAFAPSGEEIKGVENYSYLDLNVVRGESFGAQVPIYLPDDTTRKVSVFVTEAVYEDGGVWRQEKEEWMPVPQQETITDKFAETELRKQYEIEVGGNCDFVPEMVGGLFLCACGAVNLAADETCWSCGRNASDLVGALDMKTLISKRDARLEQEEQKRIQKAQEMEAQRLEQERKAEEKRIADIRFKKKLKRGIVLGIGATALCAGVITLTTKVIIPNKKYNDAVALEKAGNYQEAIAAFEAMGNYKDSPEKILECKYAEVEAELEAKDYSGALYKFVQIEDDKESKQYFELAEKFYQVADELEQTEEYTLAGSIFEEIKDYGDSAERRELLNKSIYNQGLEYLAKGDYETAYQKFSDLGDEYLESKDYRIYCKIRKINFDDGQLHFLDDLMEMVKDISNDTLKEGLKDIPQIAMCIQLEGKWREKQYTGYGSYYGEVIDIRDGKIDGDAISYFNGEYFSGIDSVGTDDYGKIRCGPEETPYTVFSIYRIWVVDQYIRL